MVHSSVLGKVRPAIHWTETVLIFIHLSVRRSNEREVDVGMVVREPQTICFEGLQVLELRQNVDLGSHLADIHFEGDEAAEDRRELGLFEGVYGIGATGKCRHL